ncbi:MAG: transglycosylase domain-containing protein [Rhodocyclaceae bacterium]
MLFACLSASFRSTCLPRLLLATVLLCCASIASAAQVLPGFEQVRASWIASDSVLLDRNGEPLADLRLDPRVRRLPWVSLQSLSPAMREALLAAEDKRFFEHSGIDWKAFIGAAWQNLWSRSRRGASTLTMQLAGMLDPALRLPAKGTERRSVTQKWDQSLAAIELEKHWTKPQILEAYLNLAPFRGDLEGIGAASQLLFGLGPEALTRREAVILAALLRGPNAKPPIVTRRACALAATLNDRQLCPAIGELAQARLNTPRNTPRFTLAPHLARGLFKEPGQQLRSTLDATQQRALIAALGREASPSWALLLDNTSGEVRAWVVQGSAAELPDPLTQRLELVQWWAPFAVAHGLADRSLTAAGLVIDGDTVLDANDARAGQRTRMLSLRTAVAGRSRGALRNVVRDTRIEALNGWLHELGLDSADSPAVSPQQLALAWRSIVSANSFVAARGLPLEAPQKRPAMQDAAFLLQDMLGAPHNGSGFRNSWLFSSSDGQWQIALGNSDRYTLLLGLRSSPSADFATHALLRWHESFGAVQKEPSRAPQASEGLVSSIIAFEPPIEPARREWFVKGTEFSPVMLAALPYPARISWPQAGAIYRLDAISADAWALRADAACAVHWVLDGKPLGQGAQVRWTPQTGRHQLRLLGPRDEVLDALDFSVTP